MKQEIRLMQEDGDQQDHKKSAEMVCTAFEDAKENVSIKTARKKEKWYISRVLRWVMYFFLSGII